MQNIHNYIVYLHNGPLEVVVDVNFGNNGGPNISEVEVPGLLAKARPTCRRLAIDLDSRVCLTTEVKDIETETCIRSEDGVLSRDYCHRKRKQASIGWCNFLEVGR